MDYGPWKKMSAEGVDFLQGCLDRDYHQRMTVRQVRGTVARRGSGGPSALTAGLLIRLICLCCSAC
jgi:hypothetical protein